MSSQPSTGTGELSAAERAFYSRQLILPEMGYEAQLALKGARVVVLGAGGLVLRRCCTWRVPGSVRLWWLMMM